MEDLVGNRVRMESSMQGVTKYIYDEDDRLLKARLSNNQTNFLSSYSYDRNGNRLTKTVNTKTVSYAYDPENRMVRFTGGDVTNEFSYYPNGLRFSRTQAG